jgi:hypothetical protein
MEKLRFIRYGGLSAYKQTHRKKDPGWFHNPPRNYGVYAFPYPYHDLFLIGATDHPSHISGKSVWLKDDAGHYVVDTRDFDATAKTRWNYTFTPELTALLKKRHVRSRDLCSFKLNVKIFICPSDTLCEVCPQHQACEAYRKEPLYLAYLNLYGRDLASFDGYRAPGRSPRHIRVMGVNDL